MSEPATAAHLSRSTVARAPIRVMIADDLAMFRDVAHDLIDSLPGFECVMEASSGQEALDALERMRPQLVLLDVRMPGMSGIETCRRLIALEPSVVVVLVTSGDTADVARAARSCGAVALLAKQNLNPAVIRGLWMIHGPVQPRRASR
jgi:two-component system, NarL family, invasion response regulator UvrY